MRERRRSRQPEPNLVWEGTKALNLTVLQRIDPLIEKILMKAAHVSLYAFNRESFEWSRKDVEGSLFVVKRPGFLIASAAILLLFPKEFSSDVPVYRDESAKYRKFGVFSTCKSENLVENLDGKFEFEVQLPYLLYQNEAQEVSGIWFYNKPSCEQVGNLFSSILSECTEAHQNPEESSNRSECEESEAVPSTSAMEDPSEQMSPLPTSAHTPHSRSFLDLLSAAFNSQKRSISTESNAIYSQNGSAALPCSSNSSTPQTPSTLYEPSHPQTHSEHVPKLVKPSLFFGPPVPSLTLPVSTQHPLNLQLPRGSSLLQPFSPLTPPSSLTPGSASHYGLLQFNKEKVKDALQILVQDDRFIGMFQQALQKVHHTNNTL